MQTITRAILPRNQLPSVSNSQRGWSCKQIFDSSTTFLNPLVGRNSLYGKRTVGFFHSPHTPVGRVRLLQHALPISLFSDFEKKNRPFCILGGTRCYRVLQDVTWCYRVLHGVTRCYMVIQRVRRCYRVLHGVTRCYRMLHGVTWCYTVSGESVTGCYIVLQKKSLLFV